MMRFVRTIQWKYNMEILLIQCKCHCNNSTCVYEINELRKSTISHFM